jgi:hypothetical protein
LPKSLGRKRIKFPADEFGFSVDPQLAKEFRDIRWEIARLAYKRNKLPPDAFAKKVSKLHARLNAIRQVLQPPDYSKYNKKAIDLDEERLQTLRQRRASNVIFSPKEDMEEARRMVRLESFLVGLENFFAEPEKVDRARFEELHQKNRRSTMAPVHRSLRRKRRRTDFYRSFIHLIRLQLLSMILWRLSL